MKQHNLISFYLKHVKLRTILDQKNLGNSSYQDFEKFGIEHVRKYLANCLVLFY